MGQPGEPLKHFGKAVTRAQEPQLRRVNLTGGRERLVNVALRAESGGTKPKVRYLGWNQRPVLSGSLIGIAAALIVIFVASLRTEPLSFQVGNATPGVVGAFLEPSGAGLPIRFSDGTLIALDVQTGARIAGIDEHGARVLLERGRLSAAVIHSEESRWSISAGPFEVLVTGTKFDLMWDPAAEILRLVLKQGSVVVRGGVAGDGRAVVSGESLEISCRDGTMNLSRGVPASPTNSAVVVGSAPSRPTSMPRPASSTRDVGSRVSWQDLAAGGHYKEAISAIDVEGFDVVSERSSATDLLALADAARFAGEGGRAVQVLSVLRRRFSGTVQAGTAAFLLGKIAFDQQGAFAEADHWFSTYLGEQVGGPLAREASGRLIECRLRTGNMEGAREAAHRYLEVYPSGPHADSAKRVIEE